MISSGIISDDIVHSVLKRLNHESGVVRAFTESVGGQDWSKVAMIHKLTNTDTSLWGTVQEAISLIYDSEEFRQFLQ